jgi:pSer/pThr/pTyr-binding forkhead associated (FHA) protein
MQVSRVHAMLLYEGGLLHVIDAGSTNGTLVRGRNIHCEPMPPGERVELAQAHVIWDPAN